MDKVNRGFTLIELLTVVGVIAVLMAILLPSLAKGKLLARQARTASDMHQMLLAYREYSADNDGRVLPGFLPDSVNWTVRSVQYGITVSGHPATRYPWRFLPYLRDWRILFNNTAMPASAVDAYAYQLSLLPKFGLNSAFVGGDHEFGGFDAAGNANPAGGGGGAVVFRDIDARQPASLLVFAETACFENGKAFAFPGGTLPGECPPDDLSQYFQLQPPSYAGNAIWHVNPAGGGTVAADSQAILGAPVGVVANRPVAGFFDGHAEARRVQELQDLRLWRNAGP